jgi:hypothetical protein
MSELPVLSVLTKASTPSRDHEDGVGRLPSTGVSASGVPLPSTARNERWKRPDVHDSTTICDPSGERIA